MTDHIDATNPANIAATWDGLPASRITVLAAVSGQVFDRENGNASAAQDAAAVHTRFLNGCWSIGYVNESLEQEFTDALAALGLAWLDAGDWPQPGIYEWCADPSGNIAAGRWRPKCVPILVQDRYPGPYDLSTVAASTRYPGRVAGYIDGPQSAWPAPAWSRFATIPDWFPRKDDDMPALRKTTGETFTFSGTHKTGIPTIDIEAALMAAGLQVAFETDPAKQAAWDAYVDSIPEAAAQGGTFDVTGKLTLS